MTTVAKKMMLGTAAFAVAAALCSPVVAIGAPDDSAGDSVGTSAGNTPKRQGRGAKQPAAPAPVADAPAGAPSVSADVTAPSATGSNPLFQNPLIWVGTPNPTPPPGTTIRTFQPLAEVPEWAAQSNMFGWMEGFEFEACVLGLSAVNYGQTIAGPYGSSTTGFSSSGCA